MRPLHQARCSYRRWRPRGACAPCPKLTAVCLSPTPTGTPPPVPWPRYPAASLLGRTWAWLPNLKLLPPSESRHSASWPCPAGLTWSWISQSHCLIALPWPHSHLLPRARPLVRQNSLAPQRAWRRLTVHLRDGPVWGRVPLPSLGPRARLSLGPTVPVPSSCRSASSSEALRACSPHPLRRLPALWNAPGRGRPRAGTQVCTAPSSHLLPRPLSPVSVGQSLAQSHFCASSLWCISSCLLLFRSIKSHP